jgi:cystathionine beta-lyase/cystathionine gamma-synthase
MPSRRNELEEAVSRALPVVPPIYQSVTFYLDETSYADIREGGLHEPWYGRFSNPTVEVAAAAVARLEDAEAALMTSSGMGAIATSLLTLCRPGDRIVAGRQVYGDTHDLLMRDLARLGVQVDLVEATDLEEWSKALGSAPCRVAYAEVLSNPELGLLDVSAVAGLAHEHGATLVVDSTFATPYLVRPLALGADVVTHSATKFLNGHSDVIAGVVAADRATIDEIRRRVITFGTNLDPHAAFLVWRGMQTFDVRMQRQCASALALANALAGHPTVERVYYPGRPDYPFAETARSLLSAGRGGAMLAFTVAGGNVVALDVLRRLRVANEATSLGGVETLASAPFNSSHPSLTEEELRAAGIEDGLLRISVGLEPVESLIDDFTSALGDRNPHRGQDL